MTDAAQRARTAQPPPQPPQPCSPLATSAAWDDDHLDEVSNSVLDLIKQQRFEEALAVCERLRTGYPDVIDWLDRCAMVHEARGDHALAADFYRRALAFTERPGQHDHFDQEGRDYFREKIAQLEARIAPPPTS